MIEYGKKNPFQILGISTGASNRDVVSRADEAADEAGNPEGRQLVQWAREQISTHPDIRLAWELLEPPGATYDGSSRWQQFSERYRRPPTAPAGDSATALPQSAFDWSALLSLAVDGLLETEPPDLRPAVQQPPVTLNDLPPLLEVKHVLFG
jgi:hypothetical protein